MSYDKLFVRHCWPVLDHFQTDQKNDYKTKQAALQIWLCTKTVLESIYIVETNKTGSWTGLFFCFCFFCKGSAQSDVMFIFFSLQFMVVSSKPGSAGQERQVTGVHDETWVKIQTFCKTNKCGKKYHNTLYIWFENVHET